MISHDTLATLKRLNGELRGTKYCGCAEHIAAKEEVWNALPALLASAETLQQIVREARRYIPAVMTGEEKAAAFDVLLALLDAAQTETT